MKDQLIFDASAFADSDKVGAYIVSSDGTLIDKQVVNSINRLAVDSTLKDGAGVALTSTLVGGKQSLDVRVSEGINVEVDLAAADDSVSAWTKDGAGVAITSTVVGGDTGLDVNIINATLTVSDAALANTAVTSNTNTLGVADTAEAAVTAPLANRKYLMLYNFSNKQIYIGGASVTEANGFPLSPGSYLEMRAGAASPVNYVGKAGQLPEIRTLELS